MSNRIDRFREKLPQGVDCAIVTSNYGRHYFTGCRSDAGTLVVTRDKSYFIIDFRFIEDAKRTVTTAEVILQDQLYSQILEILGRHNVKTVGLETSYMTMGEFTRMQEKLPGIELLSGGETDKVIVDLRAHKDEQEFRAMKAAQDIADKTFTHMLNYIEVGKTERELALELQYHMLCLGAEKLSFDTICVSGVNTSLPHGVPTDKKIQNGEFLTMDFGAMVDGYCSDMTRTVAIGHVTDEMELVYSTVLKAQLASLAAIVPGTPNTQIDKVGRDIIYAAGYEGCFGHGTGHSVGLEIHEEPRYSISGSGVCEVGHVMTVEPGIYLEGRFGVRIEDMIYIGENGIKNFASSPKDLIIL
ncbi:MAG: aminopeptidase P family protein [Angelakisella sp.]